MRIDVVHPLTFHTGIPALFEFSVEGDAAVDPNAMVLWFQQPKFGLPSKVCVHALVHSHIFPQRSLGIL
jgi:predicted metalloendopeptidase